MNLGAAFLPQSVVLLDPAIETQVQHLLYLELRNGCAIRDFQQITGHVVLQCEDDLP